MLFPDVEVRRSVGCRVHRIKEVVMLDVEFLQNHSRYRLRISEAELVCLGNGPIYSPILDPGFHFDILLLSAGGSGGIIEGI